MGPQIALGLVVAAVAVVLLRAAKESWEAGEKILTAFAALLGVLVKTLPPLLIAGLIAAGGVWLINTAEKSGITLSEARDRNS